MRNSTLIKRNFLIPSLLLFFVLIFICSPTHILSEERISLDKGKLTATLRAKIAEKIEAGIMDLANKAEGEVRARTYFDELLRPYEEFGILETNFAEKAVELYQGYQGADDKSAFMQGQVKSTVTSVLTSALDKHSQEIVSSLESLWSDAQSNMSNILNATSQIEADPTADATQILRDHGLAGGLIDDLEYLETNARAIQGKLAGAAEVYKAFNIIRTGMGSSNPGDKMDALFTLGAEFGGKIPILGKFVELYAKVAQEMINAIGRLGKILRKRQGYCVGQGTTGHIPSKWMDVRSKAWADHFPKIDACPHSKLGIYKDIYKQVGAAQSLFFWVGGGFVKGIRPGGIEAVKAIVRWLRRKNHKLKAINIKFIAGAYNVFPGGYLSFTKDAKKMAQSMQREVRRISSQLLCNKEETQRYLLQDLGLKSIIDAIEMDTDMVTYFPWVEEITDKVIEERLIDRRASFLPQCKAMLKKLANIIIVQIQGTVKDSDDKGVSGLEISVSPKSKILEECSKLTSGSGGTFRIVLPKTKGESFSLQVQAKSSNKSSEEKSLSLSGSKREYTIDLEMEGSEIDSISISPTDKTINVDEKVSFVITAKMEDGSEETISNSKVTWGVAKNGIFTGTEAGSFTITAEYKDKFASASVTVEEKEIDSFKVTASKTKVKLDEKVTLTAKVTYKDKSVKNVTDETTFEPAEIDTSTPGEKEVTGTFKDVSDTVTVTVLDKVPKSLTLEADKQVVTVGDKVVISAILTYEDGSSEDVTDSDSTQFAPSQTFTAKEAGIIEIKATFTKDGDPPISVSGSIKITVREIVSLTITPDQAKIKINERKTFKAAAHFKDGSSENVTNQATWTPSASFVGREKGTFGISATYKNKKASATVTVTKEGDKDEDEGDLDDALDDIKDEEDKDPCDQNALNAKIEQFNALKGNVVSKFGNFTGASAKFYQEINARRADPCTNNIVAFTYYTAKGIASEVEAIAQDMKNLYTEIVIAGALCKMENTKSNIKNLLYAFNDVGPKIGTIKRTLTAMKGRLAEFSCDEDEVTRNGEQVSAQGNIDPEFLQDGGAMGEVQGDGVDQTGEGFQDEGNYSGSVVILVWDSGTAKDDIFAVSLSKYGSLGTTPKGGRGFFARNLEPGNYTVTITTLETDVGAGTWSVKVSYKGTVLVVQQGSNSGAVAFTIPAE